MVSFSLSLILFPFYVQINRSNRTRDEKTAIFPYSNHFYQITCVTESLTYLGLLLIPIAFLASKVTNDNAYSDYYLYFYWALWVGLKLVTSLVADFLVALLSIHRCVLYYYPDLGDLNYKRGYALLIIALYLLSIVITLWFYVSFMQDNDRSSAKNYLIVLISFHCCLLLCSSPYLFMVISIRKLSHLASNIQSKPKQFIKYQIFLIVFKKLFIFPLSVLASTIPVGEDPTGLAALYDSLTTSFTVQLAYLLSNKSNLETFLKTKWNWRVLKEMFVPRKNYTSAGYSASEQWLCVE